MVVDFGMSDLGPIALGPVLEMTEWGRSYTEPDQISEGMKEKVDAEIKKLIDQAMKRSEELLKKNRKKMDRLVAVLLKQETVETEEFEKVMGVGKVTLEEK